MPHKLTLTGVSQVGYRRYSNFNGEDLDAYWMQVKEPKLAERLRAFEFPRQRLQLLIDFKERYDLKCGLDQLMHWGLYQTVAWESQVFSFNRILGRDVFPLPDIQALPGYSIANVGYIDYVRACIALLPQLPDWVKDLLTFGLAPIVLEDQRPSLYTFGNHYAPLHTLQPYVQACIDAGYCLYWGCTL